MSKKITPQIAAAVFCDSASKGDSAKVDCKGVFTSFLAWAYPTAIRIWHAVLTVYSLPKGTTTITASISRNRGKKTTLSSIDVLRGKVDIGTVINMPLRYSFPQEGFYNVHFNVVGTTASLKVKVLVATQPWPFTTKRQRDFLRSNPAVPHSIMMNVLCSECSRPFILEESVIPDEQFAEGVLPFPDSGKLECGTCSHILHLKDIQGQLRSSITAGAKAAMRGGK
jgi:hypothetical protein